LLLLLLLVVVAVAWTLLRCLGRGFCRLVDEAAA
jgi:hypothetical protein